MNARHGLLGRAARLLAPVRLLAACGAVQSGAASPPLDRAAARIDVLIGDGLSNCMALVDPGAVCRAARCVSGDTLIPP